MLSFQSLSIHAFKLGVVAGIAGVAGLLSVASAASAELCVECLNVRVGPPKVVRGPFPDEIDATFTAIKLADGSFRGFSANGTTYAIDGSSLNDMAGDRRPVLTGTAKGGVSDCGRWLTSTWQAEANLVGFVHQERQCDYSLGRTHKSMAIATSTDGGLSWSEPFTVITGTDQPAADRFTGEGDCSLINGRDGYYYAYCLRNSDWQTIVARAQIDDIENWHKYFAGEWSEPGLGGQADAIGFLGPGAAYFEGFDAVATVAIDPWFKGLRLSLSKDKVHFVDLAEPLIAIDAANWSRPAETELVAYATMLNADNGSSVIEDGFLLTYSYVPPNKGFESRYLVQQEVNWSASATPQAVQVGAALMRWVNESNSAFISSTGPVTQERDRFRQDAQIGYMLTRAPNDIASVKIDECIKEGTQGVDYILAEEATCAAKGYRFMRTSGWLFQDDQPNATPIFSCRHYLTGNHYVSGASACEGRGEMVALLGYGLAQ